ncbi:MAG: pyridoxamine 5'-phosphate oxidase family protein, partial [Acidobacteria bacterium]|nr:pyridoxamine 5'-phosphate oxidase family protein [Acidobacteriota bacterium]
MPDTPAREVAIRKLDEMIKGIPVGMLTTVTERGWLRSRPMVVQSEPFDGTLWFLSGAATSKARDVRDRQQVNVCYVSGARDRYVSVSGTATLVTDPQKVAAVWNNTYAEWFPRGPSDPDLVFIKVQVEEAEYWDTT